MSKLVPSCRLGLRGIIGKSGNFHLTVFGLRIQNLRSKARNRDVDYLLPVDDKR